MEDKLPDAVKVVLGDFNGSNFEERTSLCSWVKCETRDDKTLDLLYCIVKAVPALGDSDHYVTLHS